MKEEAIIERSGGVILKPAHAIEKMRLSGKIVAETLESVRSVIRPGATTLELDLIAEEVIRSHRGARPAFKGYRGFPATLCVSVNDEVVHGIPSGKRRLRDGDIVSLDVGVCLDGYYADAAITAPVGSVPEDVARFLGVTHQALMEGLERARAGNRLGDISAKIQEIAERNGYSVVRSLVGHGIGTHLHEEPQVPNFGFAGTGMELREGLALAIEPMFNMGGWEVKTLHDGWTVVTLDGSASAHFEHTVVVTSGEPVIITSANGR